MESLYSHVGGWEALGAFNDVFYDKVLTDPVLKGLFGDRRPEHVTVLTAFTAQTFGGPDLFSREMGDFERLIDVHRGLKITEEQRQRFVELYWASADEAGLPNDERFRKALREHLVFGSHVAMQNSNAQTDDELHPLREVPRWSWPEE